MNFSTMVVQLNSLIELLARLVSMLQQSRSSVFTQALLSLITISQWLIQLMIPVQVEKRPRQQLHLKINLLK
jgi:hypothetical protein